MATYLLYVITGIVLTIMSARHLVGLRQSHSKPKHSMQRLDILHIVEAKGLQWAEATLAGAILLVGLWMTFTAGLLLIAGLLRSF
jgi:hypothetical protein